MATTASETSAETTSTLANCGNRIASSTEHSHRLPAMRTGSPCHRDDLRLRKSFQSQLRPYADTWRFRYFKESSTLNVRADPEGAVPPVDPLGARSASAVVPRCSMGNSSNQATSRAVGAHASLAKYPELQELTSEQASPRGRFPWDSRDTYGILYQSTCLQVRRRACRSGHSSSLGHGSTQRSISSRWACCPEPTTSTKLATRRAFRHAPLDGESTVR